jgi:hypothetical protein
MYHVTQLQGIGTSARTLQYERSLNLSRYLVSSSSKVGRNATCVHVSPVTTRDNDFGRDFAEISVYCN